MAISEKIISHIPFLTLAILGLSLVTYALPEVSAAFIYDRKAIFEGEIWRLLSSHLVHFTNLHLFYDLLAFGMAGWIIEYRTYRYFGLLCILMAFFISLSLLIMKPNMIYYGGLSGLVYGAMCYLALWGLRDLQPWRSMAIVILFFMPIKFLFDFYLNESILPYTKSHVFQHMHLSHIIGCLVALCLFFIIRFNEYRQNPVEIR
ncbi:MAG: rhombosortase [Gammaproteobacteria bacterium]|nr:MAG: rhombosortase [Gammaproteobacteria bacterium]RKZ73125.1 MAG: rhombosortase [Gammaproteobacteria bacterium]